MLIFILTFPQPGPNSTEENLQCFCNHLTSFGGDLFATPNDIDFDEVFIGFASLGKTGNVGVIIAVGVFFLLYIVGVVFARRADRRDKEQVSPYLMASCGCSVSRRTQLCPGLNANAVHVLYDRHHKVSSLIKVLQNTPNSVKYEVIWKRQIT